MQQSELNEIIENHRLWLRDDGGERAYLSRAYLYGANLSSANLYGADLYGADLFGADLSGANLYDTIGNMREIKSLQTDRYPITYTAEVMQIGCENHTLAEWWEFDDQTIYSMNPPHSLPWWGKWKPILLEIIEEASPATPTGVDK